MTPEEIDAYADALPKKGRKAQPAEDLADTVLTAIRNRARSTSALARDLRKRPTSIRAVLKGLEAAGEIVRDGDLWIPSSGIPGRGSGTSPVTPVRNSPSVRGEFGIGSDGITTDGTGVGDE